MTEARAENPETIRQWDRIASEEYGLPGIVLMENAGAGAARIISRLSRENPEHFPAPFIILCGPGSNGGDGYVVARHLFNSGHDVEVYLCFEPGGLDKNSDAGVNLAVIEKMGIPAGRPGQDEIRRILQREDPATVIDALLGIGLSRTLKDPFLAWVQAASASGKSVIALDIPTGLDGKNGEILGDCVPASHTITFAAPKTGFYQGSGPDITGHIHVVGIGLPRDIRENREKQQR